MELFPLSSVRLENGLFKDAQETAIRYILALKTDRLLAPYRREAGLPAKAESYGNWENTGLDGHMGGHYLSALSLMTAATGNQLIKDRLNYMLGELKRCQEQDPDGYIGGIPGGKEMWKEIRDGKIDAASFSLNGKWVPIYNIHKLFAGLIDAYYYTGNEEAKQMVFKLADWWLGIFGELTDQQIQTVLASEHGGINEVFADLAQISGNPEYLRMAQRLSHRAILEPLEDGKDELTGLHANTQIPKVIGFEKIGALSDSLSWINAARFFWETVVGNRTVSIGGNSESEHFHSRNSFEKMLSSREGPETCNTYNMLKLSKALYLQHPERKYIDYYERATYNHILSSQHPGTGGFVYFTSIRPNHYRVYSQAQLSFWCCVGSGLENHAKYGELIYSHKGKDIYVNLFIPSTLNWEQGGIKLHQETRFPHGTASELTLEIAEAETFSVFIRKPDWLEGQHVNLLVNGKNMSYKEEGEYIQINRRWEGKTLISFDLPMRVRAEFLPSGEPWVSYSYGPIVLAAKKGTEDLKGLFADDKRMGHIGSGALLPMDKNPILVAPDQDVAGFVHTLDAGNLRFELDHLCQGNAEEKITLQPFFSLHDARYTLYWRVADRHSLDSINREAHLHEQRQLALDSNMVDLIALGEQQPEADHHMQQEETYTGVLGDYHWRGGPGWFSYELNNKNQSAKAIYIKQIPDAVSCYELTVDGQLLRKEKQLANTDGSIIVVFKLNAPLARRDKLQVKVSACVDKETGKVVEIRLLK